MSRFAAWLACTALIGFGLMAVDRVIMGSMDGVEAFEPWIIGALLALLTQSINVDFQEPRPHH